MIPYRQFNHTADLGIEVFGGTTVELFTNAAFAVFDLLTDISLVEKKETREIKVEGVDMDDLLVNFLREALYLFNGGHWLAREFTLREFGLEVKRTNKLLAEVRGEPFDPSRHRIKTELKAVTYHQLGIRKIPGGCTTKVVFDV
jgi:SHS2 domain-containing protein